MRQIAFPRDTEICRRLEPWQSLRTRTGNQYIPAGPEPYISRILRQSEKAAVSAYETGVFYAEDPAPVRKGTASRRQNAPGGFRTGRKIPKPQRGSGSPAGSAVPVAPRWDRKPPPRGRSNSLIPEHRCISAFPDIFFRSGSRKHIRL